MSVVNVPPCQAACPINTDVRGYVSAIARGDEEEAIRIVRQVNPLPSVCGRICTRLCEKACRRAQVDEPVSIRALKRFAADRTRALKLAKKSGHSYEEKIAVIGSGPAGLTAAHDLALLGYKVTIIEAQSVLGGLLIEGIPEYRLPKKLVREEIDSILSLGIDAKTGLSLGKDFTLEDLLKDYDAVFLAVGSQKGLMPKCEGSDLPGVVSGVDFLKQVSRGQIPDLGSKVLIVGGGHTAIDAARTCIRLGVSDVAIVYRRTLDEMPAGREEVDDAEREGIRMIYLSAPVRFAGEDRVRSVRFIRMELGEPDASGRRRPVPIEGSEFEMEADTVISAVGYIPDPEVLSHSGLNLSKKGTVAVRDETGITNMKGVFAGGDVVTGPLSVIEAMASGRRAAEAIHRSFRNLPEEKEEGFAAVPPLDDNVLNIIAKTGRRRMSSPPSGDLIDNFGETESGFSREDACSEALRCMNCGAGASVSENCAVCLNCVRICPFGAAVPGEDIVEIDLSRCQACGICAAECPASAIDLKHEGGDYMRAELERVVDMAREESPDLLTVGFYCRYKSPLGPPLDSEEVYWIGKFCTGRMSESQLIYPFELGADGVAVHMCGDGECRFRNGAKRLADHIKKARRVLKETGIGAYRLKVVSEDEDFSDFRTKLEAMGINPLRTGKKVGA